MAATTRTTTTMAPLLRSLGSRFLNRRGFSQGSGKVLNEEEKASENIYIKKMEQEKLEELARKGVVSEEQKADKTAGDQSTASSEGVSPDTTKNYAVAATVVAIVSGVWWYMRSRPKMEEETD